MSRAAFLNKIFFRNNDPGGEPGRGHDGRVGGGRVQTLKEQNCYPWSRDKFVMLSSVPGELVLI